MRPYTVINHKVLLLKYSICSYDFSVVEPEGTVNTEACH
jgi:hypothetical protein